MVPAGRAARLIGLQYDSQSRTLLQPEDGDLGAAAQYLESMFSGLGDETEIIDNNNDITLRQTGLRIVRSLENEERDLLLKIWVQLWQRAMASYQQMKIVIPSIEHDALISRLEELV